MAVPELPTAATTTVAAAATSALAAIPWHRLVMVALPVMEAAWAHLTTEALAMDHVIAAITVPATEAGAAQTETATAGVILVTAWRTPGSVPKIVFLMPGTE